MDHQALLKQFEHLNHGNPDTFEVEDLDRLIKSVQAVMKKKTFKLFYGMTFVIHFYLATIVAAPHWFES